MRQDRNLSGCQIFSRLDLPSDWTCAPLGDRIELAYGKALREEDRKPGDVDVYGSNGRVGAHNVALVDRPGILVGRKGTVGAVHYAPSRFWPIDTVYYIIQKSGDNLSFLHYLLDYLPLVHLNAATGVPGLSRRDAYALRGAFPPINEQAAIAHLLDAMEITLQRTRVMLSAAKTLAASLSEDAVGGVLLKREDEPWVHPRLGSIPKNWSVIRLSKACSRIVDGTHQAVQTSKAGVPFLYVSCVRDGRILWENAATINERTNLTD
jgi:type I restriction enzyme S subunit